MLHTPSPSRGRRILGAIVTGIASIAACTAGTGVQAAKPDGQVIAVIADLDNPVQGQIPDARYPTSLRGSGAKGWVDLQYVVDTIGHVEPNSFKIVNQTHEAFIEPAKEAVLAGVYTPAKFRGQPTRQLVQVRVAFQEKADSATP